MSKTPTLSKHSQPDARFRHLLPVLLLLFAVSAACNMAIPPLDKTPPPPSQMPAASEAAADVTPAASLPPTATADTVQTPGTLPPVQGGEPPAAVQAVRLEYAIRIGVPAADIPVESVEEIVWDSTCLGVTPEGVVCEPRDVPGYRFTLVDGGERYIYHVDETGALFYLAEAPPVDTGALLVSWVQQNSRCEQLRIGTEGAAFGDCGLPILKSSYAVDVQSGDLGYLLQTYGPFAADTAAGQVTFNGTGAQTAGPVEQRMIAEWARYTRDIIWSGRVGAAWGLAITWVSEPDCATVHVFVTGVAEATRCDVDYVVRDLGRMRLSPEQLETFYDYYDTYQAFEWTGAAAGSSISVLHAGRGGQWPSPEEQAAISDFVRTLLFQFPAQGYEFPVP